MTVRDRDRGVAAFIGKLDAMAHARLTVGVHADVAEQPHPGSTATIGEVAAVQELGDQHQAPRAFVRGAIDGANVGAELRAAAGRALAGSSIEREFAVLGQEYADEMRRRAPVETGALRDAIETRVNGARTEGV